jgi:hypothetical protein
MMTGIPNRSPWRALAVLLCAIPVDACRDSRPPSSPSTPTPTDTTDYHLSFTVSGTVVEHLPSGVRPLPGLRIQISESSQPWDYGELEITSDREGRYKFQADVGSLVAFDLPAGAGYHAPCPPGVEHLVEDTTLDVHVVSDAVLKGTGMPESMPTWRPRVTGTVLAATYDGWELVDVRPIVGASVELAGDTETPLRSVTLTNARGDYLLCANPPGTEASQPGHIRVVKDGRELASKSVTVTGDTVVSFELEN